MKTELRKFLNTDQKSITSLFSKDLLNEGPICKLNKIIEADKNTRDYMIYETGSEKNSI